MGRRKLVQFRALAAVQGWPDAEALLPDRAQIGGALEPAKQAASAFKRAGATLSATAILAALKRNRSGAGGFRRRPEAAAMPRWQRAAHLGARDDECFTR